MRALITLLLLAPLAACSEGSTPPLANPTAPVASSHTAGPLPTGVTCPDGEPTVLQLDDSGDRSFTELLTAWSKQLGRPVVDRSRRQVWFVRDDGSAHTRLEWTRMRRPVAGRAWFVDGLEQCKDHERWRTVATPSVPVTLTVGHCWVEPVSVGGRRWDVVREDQFGWGGPMPRRLALPRPGTAGTAELTGTLAVAGDTAVYVDDSGARLTLVPAGDPWTLTRRGCD